MATLTLPGADIRGYYHRLGVQLPERARREAAVRCFADPGAHRRGDRDPSCSVNVINGAWQCHGCGARGGAYDAALAKGYTPRSAIDLMIAYGLIERRAQLRTARELVQTSDRPPAARTRAQKPSPHAQRCKSASRTSVDGRHCSPAARPCSRDSPATADGATRRCARSSSGSTAGGSRSRSATPTGIYAVCFATNQSTPTAPKC